MKICRLAYNDAAASPSDCIENGPAAASLVSRVRRGGCSFFTPVGSDRPAGAPILNRNDITGICKTAHLLFRMGK